MRRILPFDTAAVRRRPTSGWSKSGHCGRRTVRTVAWARSRVEDVVLGDFGVRREEEPRLGEVRGLKCW